MNLGELKSEAGKHPGPDDVCDHDSGRRGQTNGPGVVILRGWRTGDRLIDNDWANNNAPGGALVYSDMRAALAVAMSRAPSRSPRTVLARPEPVRGRHDRAEGSVNEGD